MPTLARSLFVLTIFRFSGIATGAPLTITDFDAPGFTPGESVHNHSPDGTNPAPPISNINQAPQAWFVPANSAGADQEIVNFGGGHGNVWRLSQGNGTGTLGGAIQSPYMGMVAGETGALNDAGRGPVTTSSFYGQFDFRSATGAPQANLAISVTGASFDQRHGFVRILDDGANGFDLLFFDTVGDSFIGTNLDLDLSYDEWHTVGIEILFEDGFASGTFGDDDAIGNDVANIYVNGVLVHTGTSWESIYADGQNHAESIDVLQFSAATIPGQLGNGLLFDNVIVTDVREANQTPIPEPASLAIWGLLGLGTAGAGVVRRRRYAA
jgi:hypothetical protein